jgi:hypothetical protein
MLNQAAAFPPQPVAVDNFITYTLCNVTSRSLCQETPWRRPMSSYPVPATAAGPGAWWPNAGTSPWSGQLGRLSAHRGGPAPAPRLRKLVYWSTFVPAEGRSMMDEIPQRYAEMFRQTAAASGQRQHRRHVRDPHGRLRAGGRRQHPAPRTRASGAATPALLHRDRHPPEPRHARRPGLLHRGQRGPGPAARRSRVAPRFPQRLGPGTPSSSSPAPTRPGSPGPTT